MFTHFLVDVILSCFQFLVIMNKIAWIFMYKSFFEHLFFISLFLFLCVYLHLGVNLLGHRLDIYLTLYETGKKFSKVVIQFYTPTTSNVKNSRCSHLISNWCYVFNFIPLSERELVSHYDFNCYFSDDLWTWAPFHA